MDIPPQHRTVEEWTVDLIAFVHKPIFKQLSGGIHVLDFFTLNVWENLPEEWTTWFSSVDNAIIRQDIITGLDRPDRPTSLTRFLTDLRRLTLPRAHTSRSVPDLNRQIALGMKPKKLHEVSHFASLVADLGSKADIHRAIDIGAGQGYLTRTLAHYYGFDVLAIDGQETQITGSQSLTSSARLGNDDSDRKKRVIGREKSAQSTATGHSSTGSIHYMIKMVRSGDLPDVDTWTKNVRDGEHTSNTAPNEGPPDTQDPLFPRTSAMVVALHACGSLTDDALRVFLVNDAIRACAVIGCCYNHIRTRAEGHADGFPLSIKLADLDVSMCGTARMLACQAPGNWTAKTSANFFKRHFYRALFQRLAVDKQLPPIVRGEKMVIGGLPRTAYVSFPAYVTGCLRKLGLESEVVDAEAEAARYEHEYAHKEDHIRIAWTLSAILAPLLESLILLDRYLFLQEQGIQDVQVVPCFDYAVSPRNMVIIARKP